MNEVQLPQLPEKEYLGDDCSYGYDSESMLLYGRACYEAGRQQRGGDARKPTIDDARQVIAEHRDTLKALAAHKTGGGDAALLQTLIGNCSSCDTHYVKKGEHEGKPRSILLTLRAGESTNPRMQEQLRVILGEFAGHCAVISAQQRQGEGGE